MIYPDNFEQKIGFNEIRNLLRERCLSTLGKEQVEKMHFSSDADEVNEWLLQTREFRRLMEEVEDFPLQYFYDVRESIVRIRVENTHLEEDELFDLRRSLSTIDGIVKILNHSDDDEAEQEDGWRREKKYPYPALHRLSADVMSFPQLVQRIDQILDKFGKIRDNATPELLQIRRELAKTEGSISRTLYGILRAAQSEGVVEKDVTPTLRDGRLVIPVIPTLKRKIKGIVHDESATGRTVFIEPTEVVEANNRVRGTRGRGTQGNHTHPHRLHQQGATLLARDIGQLPIPCHHRPDTGQGKACRDPESHRTRSGSPPTRRLDQSHSPAAQTLVGEERREGGATRHHADTREAHPHHLRT